MKSHLLLVAVALVACRGGKISSDEEAEYAAAGLDRAISRAMDLGLQGFNDADSANIPEEVGDGEVSGTMTINGQADQGSSDNKGLRLDVALLDYSDVEDLNDDDKDEIAIIYDTDPDEALPYYQLQLKGIPDGTIEGSFTGTFLMSGDLEDAVELDLAISGPLEHDEESDNEQGTRRIDGETHVTGTADTGRGGHFDIDLML